MAANPTIPLMKELLLSNEAFIQLQETRARLEEKNKQAAREQLLRMQLLLNKKPNR